MIPSTNLSYFEAKLGDDWIPVQFAQLEVGDIFRVKNDPRQTEWSKHNGEIEQVVLEQPALRIEALSVHQKKVSG